MFVGDFCNCINVRNITVGISQGFQVYSFCVFFNSRFYFLQIMDIYKGCGNAVLRQSMGQKIIAASVDGLLGDDVLSGLSQSLNGISNGGGAGSLSQGGNSAF